MNVEIVPVERVSDELVDAFARLVPQLSTTSSPPNAVQLAEIVDAAGSVLFVARRDGHLVGALTLALYRLPTGLKAWIEDVVVDSESRGMGIGEGLSRAALEEARRRGAKHVSLTSRPGREAANRLYEGIGFERYETNVYRYRFD